MDLSIVCLCVCCLQIWITPIPYQYQGKSFGASGYHGRHRHTHPVCSMRAWLALQHPEGTKAAAAADHCKQQDFAIQLCPAPHIHQRFRSASAGAAESAANPNKAGHAAHCQYCCEQAMGSASVTQHLVLLLWLLVQVIGRRTGRVSSHTMALMQTSRA